MGNLFGCSATGERLVSAARDGDLVEAKVLLHFNPCLARYSTFGGLNYPLHFAAAKGHNEIVSLLLEHGADVDARNYCGQTALMHACRYGHWEVVQTLMLQRCNVTRADYLSGRTALHFAAVNGHVRCIRLVVADFVPSMPYDMIALKLNGERGGSFGSALSKFVNKAADGGITALHMAALNGYLDCVQFLLDIHATVSSVTFHYGTSMDLIGAGSTPLHYAAWGGNLKCCQVLLARGASRLTLNCNGWLPYDVARMWGRHWIEPWLAPNSDLSLPAFALSKFLSLPLLSVLDIAREYGLQPTAGTDDKIDSCSVCLERSCSVAAEGCLHELCTTCALHICSVSGTSETAEPPGSIPCPLCRHGIVSFVKLGGSPAKELKLPRPLSCTFCMLHTDYPETRLPVRRTDMRKNKKTSVCAEGLCPMSCTPFTSVSVPSCTCNDDLCHSLESRLDDRRDQTSLPPGSEDTSQEQECKLNDPSVEKISCSIVFWGGSCQLRD